MSETLKRRYVDICCLEEVRWKGQRGSSIKDVYTNLGIFGTPLPLSRPVHIWLTIPHPPASVDTRLALFEILRLVNNSH